MEDIKLFLTVRLLFFLPVCGMHGGISAKYVPF